MTGSRSPPFLQVTSGMGWTRCAPLRQATLAYLRDHLNLTTSSPIRLVPMPARPMKLSLGRCGSGPDHRSTTLVLHARGRFVAAEPRLAFGGTAVLVETASQATAVVVIPARGGSKGLPGKNLRSVGGMPLIVRAIDAAAQANTELFVVVSTDDKEIAEVASAAGATIVDRPAELATDEASSESAVLHALDELSKSDTVPSVVLFVQCTSPFIQGDDLDRLISRIADDGVDCAFLVAPFHRFLWGCGPDGATAIDHDPNHRLRRQELPPRFVETGAGYGFRTEGFRLAANRFFGSIGMCIVEPSRAIEIDDDYDALLADSAAHLLAPHARGTGGLGKVPIPSGLAAVAFDFDGVMTDDSAIVFPSGEEAVVVSRSDGKGIEMLREATNLKLVVLSSEENRIAEIRCRKLGLDCITGLRNKLDGFSQWLTKNELRAHQVAFVGNDVNDLECMRQAGFAVAPSDARHEVKRIAHLVLDKPGGRGSVRELAELILASGKY
jgi:YrbI family 3-deoxy-D-manno-octulosonate 8-phosphate phosphatase